MAGAGALLALLLALSGAASAANPDRQELKAREAFAAGRYDEALQLFAKLYAESLHPVYLRNIGRCHQKMREPQKAIDAFKDYLTKAKKIAPDEKKEIDGYIREMEAMRDAQARAAPPPPTSPPPLALAPAPGPGTGLGPVPPAPAPAQPEASLVSAGSAPAAASSPVYTRWWFWTAIGVVAAGGITAAVLLSSGSTRPACTGAQECK